MDDETTIVNRRTHKIKVVKTNKMKTLSLRRNKA